jgi:hypothetical protein
MKDAMKRSVVSADPDSTLIGSLSRMIQFADVVPDVYEMAIYAVCFHCQANGAFLSISGTTEYFDYVVGS